MLRTDPSCSSSDANEQSWLFKHATNCGWKSKTSTFFASNKNGNFTVFGKSIVKVHQGKYCNEI